MGIGVKWPKNALECTTCSARIQKFSGGGPPDPQQETKHLNSFNNLRAPPAKLGITHFSDFFAKTHSDPCTSNIISVALVPKGGKMTSNIQGVIINGCVSLPQVLKPHHLRHITQGVMTGPLNIFAPLPAQGQSSMHFTNDCTVNVCMFAVTKWYLFFNKVNETTLRSPV